MYSDVEQSTCSLIVKNYNVEMQGVRSKIAFYIVTMFHYWWLHAFTLAENKPEEVWKKVTYNVEMMIDQVVAFL